MTPELVEAAQQGDRAAQEDLIAGSYRQAYTLALRLMGNPDDAAEATQDAFIRVIRGLKRLREPEAYMTWMFRIVQNVCMTQMRRRGRREVPMELEAVQAVELAEEEDLATSHAFRTELERAVTDLPDIYRAVVVLRDVYGYSGEETAEALGVSVGAVKVRLHRARRKLRDALVARFPGWGDDDEGTKETA